MAEAKPPTAPYIPNAAPRPLPWKRVRKEPSTCGMSSAAMTPCTARAATSRPGNCAIPHARLAIPNPAVPARKSALRP